jgi:methylmalonyl-CoA/ethylmalonyl-CoA epimerase
MIGRLNHIAIAVPDLAKAAELYRTVMAPRWCPRRSRPTESQCVRGVAQHEDRAVASAKTKSPIANFRAQQRWRIHHVCYEVEDIYAARDKLSPGRTGRR